LEKGKKMVYDRQFSLLEFPQLIFSKETTFIISSETELYWKRTWDFKCTNRMIDAHEISYIIKGEISGDIEGHPVVLKARDIFWLNTRTAHSLRWPKDLIYYTLRFSIHNNSSEMILDKPFFVLQNMTNTEYIFRNLTLCIKSPTSNIFKDEEIKSYINLLTIHIANNILSKSDISHLRKFTLIEQEKIFKFCSDNKYKDIVSNDIANHMNLTKGYFSRIFKNTFDMSARKWLHEEKMKYASHLIIDTFLSLQEVAETVGYEDYYLFSRQFKKVLGLSPKNYKKHNIT
jgi:AraC-like DNA-binding protein